MEQRYIIQHLYEPSHVGEVEHGFTLVRRGKEWVIEHGFAFAKPGSTTQCGEEYYTLPDGFFRDGSLKDLLEWIRKQAPWCLYATEKDCVDGEKIAALFSKK